MRGASAMSKVISSRSDGPQTRPGVMGRACPTSSPIRADRDRPGGNMIEVVTNRCELFHAGVVKGVRHDPSPFELCSHPRGGRAMSRWNWLSYCAVAGLMFILTACGTNKVQPQAENKEAK